MTLDSVSACSASEYARRVAAKNFAEIEARLVVLVADVAALAATLNARRINVDAPLTGGGPLSADVDIDINQATGTTDGYLSKEDWLAFTARLINPMSQLGDLIYGGTGGAATRLAVGAAGTVLHGGATPSYSKVVEDDLTLDNVSTNDTSEAKHGFMSKLSGNATQFYNGKGQWVTPAGVTSSYTSQTFTGQTSVEVNHNFGAYPVVQVLDENGVLVTPTSITHNTVNKVTVAFASPATGTVLATLGSPQAQALKTVTNDYVVLTTDRIVKCTVAGKTMTLYTAVGNSGAECVIDNGSAGEITIATTGGQTIEGETTQTLLPDAAIRMYSDGANWRIY